MRVDVPEEKAAEEKEPERKGGFGLAAAAAVSNSERDSDDDDYDDLDGDDAAGEGNGEYSALTQQQQEELEKARNQVGPHRPSLLYCNPQKYCFRCRTDNFFVNENIDKLLMQTVTRMFIS